MGTKRIVWLVLAGIVVLGALATQRAKTFHVETMIPAPPSAIWAVLTDTSAYKDWNPVFVEVEGQYTTGARVKNLVREPDGGTLEIEAKVVKLEPERELRQRGGVPGLLTFEHQWLLVPVEGGTQVIQHEVDRGLWLWFWDSSWIEPSYRKASEALGDRVMAGAQE
ncbi:SRPBCC family protein [Hoeflea sp.]|uniref:SRPBCC family protein n=1 Tax=Hoeflea sp. TaxID=1940281 RepID=UPI003B02212E